MKNRFSKEKITLVNELIYEIKIKDAMTRQLIFFDKNATFREIQLKLKAKKISGVPILNKMKDIIGIVSIDDVISAFDKNYVDQRIADYMTKKVFTVPQNFSIISAIHELEKHKIGRLPVTESPNSKKIVGIITISDILNRLLIETQTIAEKIEEEEIKKYQLPEDLIKNSLKKVLKFDVKGDDFDNAGQAASTIKKYFKGLGADKDITRRIAIICYEAEMNICLHSLGGTIVVKIDENQNAMICAHDKGPGIPDIDLALTPGYTTASEKIRALGFGAGMGLPNIKNFADEFELKSSLISGTELIAKVKLGVKK